MDAILEFTRVGVKVAESDLWGIILFLITILVGIAFVSVHYRRKYEELKNIVYGDDLFMKFKTCKKCGKEHLIYLNALECCDDIDIMEEDDEYQS